MTTKCYIKVNKDNFIHCLKDRIKHNKARIAFVKPPKLEDDPPPYKEFEDAESDEIEIFNLECDIERTENLISIVKSSDQSFYEMTLEELNIINPL